MAFGEPVNCNTCYFILQHNGQLQNTQEFENKIKDDLKQQIKDYIYKNKYHAMYYDDEGSIGVKSLLDYLELL